MKTLNANIQRALGHAIKLHDKQLRKGTAVPYSIHPVSLAMMLLEVNLHPNIITAALLHDVIEDTQWTIDDIEAHYNENIADLVHACTEQNRSEKWEERKRLTIMKLSELSIDAKWIILADKLHNLYSMYSQYESTGEAMWEHFSRGPEKQKWYYGQLKSQFEQENAISVSKLFMNYCYYYDALFGK